MGFLSFIRKRTDEALEESTQLTEKVPEPQQMGFRERMEYTRRMIADPSVNANLLREMLPVVIRGNNRLKVETDPEVLRQELTVLFGKLNCIEDKKKRLDAVFSKLEAADVRTRRSYYLFYEEKTGDVVLASRAINAKNAMAGKADLPAVITICTLTNDVEEYSLYHDLMDTGRYPHYAAELEQQVDSWVYNGEAGMEDVAVMKQKVFSVLETAAADIQSAYDRKNELYKTYVEQQMSSPYDEALRLADGLAGSMEENVKVRANRHSDCIHIRDGITNSTISLWYNEEGISSAYYTNYAGNCQRIYDVREFEKGFLDLSSSDKTYTRLLTGKAMTSFLSLENMDVVMTPKKVPVYRVGTPTHSMDEILANVEPYPLHCRNVSQKQKDAQDGLLQSKAAQYSGAIARKLRSLEQAEVTEEADLLRDIVVDSNPFNRSVSFQQGDSKVYLMYDEQIESFEVLSKNVSERFIAREGIAEVNPLFRFTASDYVDRNRPDRQPPAFYNYLESFLMLRPLEHNGWSQPPVQPPKEAVPLRPLQRAGMVAEPQPLPPQEKKVTMRPLQRANDSMER